MAVSLSKMLAQFLLHRLCYEQFPGGPFLCVCLNVGQSQVLQPPAVLIQTVATGKAKLESQSPA